jgi:hypothetical protein
MIYKNWIWFWLVFEKLKLNHFSGCQSLWLQALIVIKLKKWLVWYYLNSILKKIKWKTGLKIVLKLSFSKATPVRKSIQFTGKWVIPWKINERIDFPTQDSKLITIAQFMYYIM